MRTLASILIIAVLIAIGVIQWRQNQALAWENQQLRERLVHQQVEAKVFSTALVVAIERARSGDNAFSDCGVEYQTWSEQFGYAERIRVLDHRNAFAEPYVMSSDGWVVGYDANRQVIRSVKLLWDDGYPRMYVE